MTLCEAIKHLEEVIPKMECSDCKDEHIQLLDWLKELHELKYNKLVVTQDEIEDILSCINVACNESSYFQSIKDMFYKKCVEQKDLK